MNRREFITLLGGGAAVAWPLIARAQQPRNVARIGFLALATGPTPAIRGFQHGLQQLGYVEGQNLVLIYRWAAGRRDRLAEFGERIASVECRRDCLEQHRSNPRRSRAQQEHSVVMVSISDPIGNNLVAGFARPGGNTTGVTLFSTELAGKRLELLKEVVPQLARVGLLVQRDHPPTATLITETQADVQALSLTLQVFEVRPEEIIEGFRSMEKDRPDALIVQQTTSFTIHLQQIADLANSYRLPTVHQAREFVQAGGLLALGPNIFALGERAAWYVDRILKGTKPADLPVEQPTKFELAINLKTARALGLTVPPTLLSLADEVIE